VGAFTGPALIAMFLVGGVATWLAGTALSRTTDALDDRLHFGEALGGVVLLAVSGSLPEVAITVSAVLQGHSDSLAGSDTITRWCLASRRLESRCYFAARRTWV
jgi:Ca2+/Na+ antiporter